MSSLRKFLPSATDNSVGSLLFADSSPSANWILCDGATLPQGTYSDLYSKVGLLVSPQFSGGSTWTIRTTAGSTSGVQFYALAYNPLASTTNGAVFVYGGDVLGTSTNAITWTARTPNTATTINALLYGGGIYVYGQLGGRLSTSTNAITWTARTSGTSSNILALAYNPDATGTQAAYIYGGVGGALRTSTDAITWTARTPNTATTINAVIYGGGIYVYGQLGGRLSTSTDAITWTARTSGTSSSISALLYGGGIYVLAGGGTTGNSALATSTDAITWTVRTTGTTGEIRCLTYGAGSFVFGGLASTLATSTDAITWTSLVGVYSSGRTDINAIVNDNNTPNTFVYIGEVDAGNLNNLATAKKYTYNQNTEFILPNYTTVSFAQSNTRVTGAATFQSQLYIKAR